MRRFIAAMVKGLFSSSSASADSLPVLQITPDHQKILDQHGSMDGYLTWMYFETAMDLPGLPGILVLDNLSFNILRREVSGRYIRSYKGRCDISFAPGWVLWKGVKIALASGDPESVIIEFY